MGDCMDIVDQECQTHVVTAASRDVFGPFLPSLNPVGAGPARHAVSLQAANLVPML